MSQQSDQLIDLQSLGLLRITHLPPQLKWLTETEKHILLYAHLAGDQGLHKSFLRPLLKAEPACVLNLEVSQLVSWSNDNHGKPQYLSLTWKGSEISSILLLIAKNRSKKPAYEPPSTPDINNPTPSV